MKRKATNKKQLTKQKAGENTNRGKEKQQTKRNKADETIHKKKAEAKGG